MKPLDIIKKYSGETAGKNIDFTTGFSLPRSLLEHTRVKVVMRAIAEIHHYSQRNQKGKGLLILGPSGVGKSSFLNHYCSFSPPVLESQLTRIPVLLVVTPSTPTVGSIAEAILTAMKDPLAQRGTVEAKTARIYQLFAICKVELLMIDEFQHFFYARSSLDFRRITDWLKNFIIETKVAVVLSGLPESEIVVKSNFQIERRFTSKCVITPFQIDSSEDFSEFRGLLGAFQKALPLPVETPLYEANMARRFMVASNGLLDYVHKILEGAVSIAGAAGHKSLDLPVFAAGFKKEVWADVGDRLNPFHPESPLRQLNRQDEPFYFSQKLNTIGSSLARRVNITERRKI